MDRFGNASLTRPATPKAFKVAGTGRYSFVTEQEVETVEIPDRLRTENVPVRDMHATKR